MGWFYLTFVGLPSVFDVSGDPLLHNQKPYEQDANYRALRYFHEKEDGFNYRTDWDFVENPIVNEMHRKINFSIDADKKKANEALGSFYKFFHF